MPIYIYALIDPRTNEVRYVGKSNNPKKRYVRHISCKDNGKYKNRWIKQLIKINLLPILNIIEECDESKWSEREQCWIKYYRELGCRLTNLTDGGEGSIGYIPTEETRKKLSDSLKGKLSGKCNPFYGKHHSEHTINIIREKRKLQIFSKECIMRRAKKISGNNHYLYGKHISEEAKMKMSEAKLGNNNPNYGKHHSEERKRKISESNKGKKRSEETRNNISVSHKGKRLSEEQKNSMKISQRLRRERERNST